MSNDDSKFYLVDYGKGQLEIAQLVINKLKADNHHVLVFLTSLDKYFTVEELTQDQFLDCYDEMNPRYDN
jgi:hypothetical protein